MPVATFPFHLQGMGQFFGRKLAQNLMQFVPAAIHLPH